MNIKIFGQKEENKTWFSADVLDSESDKTSERGYVADSAVGGGGGLSAGVQHLPDQPPAGDGDGHHGGGGQPCVVHTAVHCSLSR